MAVLPSNSKAVYGLVKADVSRPDLLTLGRKGKR
jgi:hypothetical protein